MISLALATTLAAAALQGPPAAPRRDYSSCLSKIAKEKRSEKMEKEAFTAALKTACATEEAAFRKSLVDYDVKTGSKRAAAEEGAKLQAEDYLVNVTETYFEAAAPQ
ncbi:MAG TPA: hypothetical protein VGD10_01955 [Allosphingosinicella sp.]|uniref:hypothetical protein n=1 Tax=Allosphingosinicella sp. TaxID=2823234 RepID=UPI002ED7A303